MMLQQQRGGDERLTCDDGPSRETTTGPLRHLGRVRCSKRHQAVNRLWLPVYDKAGKWLRQAHAAGRWGASQVITNFTLTSVICFFIIFGWKLHTVWKWISVLLPRRNDAASAEPSCSKRCCLFSLLQQLIKIGSPGWRLNSLITHSLSPWSLK